MVRPRYTLHMPLSPLESRLRYEFRNAELLRQALTHRSHSATHNERLEFLGDSVLNCAVAALLFQRFGKLDEGDLSRVRANLVKQQSLYEIAQALKDNPDWQVRIEGYTDNVGSKGFNLKLSQERAGSVMKWLVDHGVDRSRLSAKGYGESHPVADDATETGRAQNRRVEIVRTNIKG